MSTQCTIFNIGLTNNPYEVMDIISILNELFADTPIDFNVDEGIYNGAIEPTLIAVYDDTIDDDTIEDLCVVMLQNYIAIKRDNIGSLVYAKGYEGDEQQFNPEIFISKTR